MHLPLRLAWRRVRLEVLLLLPLLLLLLFLLSQLLSVVPFFVAGCPGLLLSHPLLARLSVSLMPLASGETVPPAGSST